MQSKMQIWDNPKEYQETKEPPPHSHKPSIVLQCNVLWEIMCMCVFHNIAFWSKNVIFNEKMNLDRKILENLGEFRWKTKFRRGIYGPWPWLPAVDLVILCSKFAGTSGAGLLIGGSNLNAAGRA